MRHLLIASVVVIFTALFSINITQAQSTDPDASHYNIAGPINLIKSPEAASLGRYGASDPSLFNGLTNIQLPLFSVKEGDIPVAASLSYNSAGVRVDDHPGWVGLNFSLVTGGVITRHQNGEIDERQYMNGSDTNLLAYFFKYDLLNNSAWATDNYINTHDPHMSGIISCDLQPDEFDFTLPTGGSGSFMMNHLGQWQVKSTSPGKFKVDMVLQNDFILAAIDPTGASRSITIKRIIYAFTITDADGVKYTFGNNDQAIEFSRGPLGSYPDGSNFQVAASAWKLTKIESPAGNIVNYSYERDGNQYLQQVTYKEASMQPYYYTLDPHIYSCTLVTPSYLKQISGSSFKISFIRGLSQQLSFPYSAKNYQSLDGFGYNDLYFKNTNYSGSSLMASSPPKWFELMGINVENNNGGFIESFRFTYNNDPTQRLMLTGIIKNGTAYLPGALPEGSSYSYTFEYNHPENLPAYNAMEADQWGYFNGILFAPADPTPSPDWESTYFRGDSVKLKYGILTKIRYPTGGSTSFEYEMNDFGQRLEFHGESIVLLNEPGVGGGLRIKKMIDSSVNGGASVRSFDYNNSNGISSGILAGNHQITISSTYSTPGVTLTVVGNNQLNKLEYTNGKDVVYSEVKETLSDGSYTVYKYSNANNTNYRDEPPLHVDARFHRSDNGFSAGTIDSSEYAYPRVTPVSRELERGQLLTKEVYSSTGKLVSRVQNTYRSDAARFNEYVRAYDYRSLAINVNGVEYSKIFGQAMKIYTYFPYLTEQTQTTYDTEGLHPVTVIHHYAYNNDYRLSKADTLWGSDNLALITAFKHPYDTTDLLSQQMVAANIISPIIQQAQYKNGQALQWKGTLYYKDTHDHFLPRASIYKLLNGAVDTLEVFTTYDQKGNLQQFRSSDGIENCFLWGYQGQFPVARITGRGLNISQIQTLVSQSKLDNAENYDIEAIRTELAKLRTGLAAQKVEIRTYTYLPQIGMTSETDPSGHVTYYDYDNYGRISKIRDENGHILKAFNYHYKTGTESQ